MSLKEKIKSGQPVFGTFNTLGSVSISKLIAASGLDFQILDLEHGPFDLSNINQHVCACHSAFTTNDRRCEMLVRNPNIDRYSILQCMDQGADGLVVRREDVEAGRESPCLQKDHKRRCKSHQPLKGKPQVRPAND